MTTVQVTCFQCGRSFGITHDDLRELNDRDGQPHCGCKKRLARPPHTTTAPRSKVDLLLLAIDAAEGGIAYPDGVTKPHIIVTAWQRSPAAFGLAGYAEYPDSNRVIMELVKMVRSGLLTQPKPSHYALTEKGRKAVELMTTAAVSNL